MSYSLGRELEEDILIRNKTINMSAGVFIIEKKYLLKLFSQGFVTACIL